jgi:hypothetical protein
MIFTLVLRLNGLGQDSVFRIFLVGDAGEDRKPARHKEPEKDLLQHPNSGSFLGDNSYKGAVGNTLPFGFLGFDSTALTQDKIRSQLNVLTGYRGSVFFIPGNHDWWNSENAEKGRRKLKMEENFIEANLRNNPTLANPGNIFLPKDGDPGTCLVGLPNQKIAVIFIDIYSLMVPGFTKKYRDSLAREYRFYSALDSLLRKCADLNQKIILAAHHPVVLRGPYGRALKDPELFSRIKASNINFPTYKRVSDSIRTIIRKYPGLIMSAGTYMLSNTLCPGMGFTILSAEREVKLIMFQRSKCMKSSLIHNTNTCFGTIKDILKSNSAIREKGF